LESRTLFAAAFPTAQEQYLIELVNRGRADPAAEGVRYGVALNEGLAAGTISTAPKQPLAINTTLITGSRGHSQWMIDNDVFSHDGAGGTDPGDRMTNAGYDFTGDWTWGENIGYRGQTGSMPNVEETAAQIHKDLFVDEGIAERGHRVNLMNGAFREVGPGIITGVFNGYNSVMVTEDFGTTGSSVFLTGVAFTDEVTNDSFYTPGEGLGAVTVTATRLSDNATFSTTTWSSGGYSLALSPGTYDVIASGGELGGIVSYDNVVIGSQNVKRDFRPDQATANFATLIGNALTVTGAPGNDMIELTSSNGFISVSVNGAVQAFNKSLVSSISIAAGDGNDVVIIGTNIISSYVDGGLGDDTIVGGDGKDTLTGAAGKDRIFGGLGDDRLNGNGGHDRLFGEAGKDRLYGGEGNDLMDGGSSTDRFWGEGGSDNILGQGGDDYFYVRDSFSDTISAGSGTDHGQLDATDQSASLEDLLA
jgi:uncharacterized protein YkwD